MAKDDDPSVWEALFVILSFIFSIGIFAVGIYVLKAERRRRFGKKLQNAYRMACDMLDSRVVQLLIIFLTSLVLQIAVDCTLDSGKLDLIPALVPSTTFLNAFLGSLLGCGLTWGFRYIHTLDGCRSALVASGVSIIFVVLKAVFIARVMYVAIIAGILSLMVSVLAFEKRVHKSQTDLKSWAIIQSAAIFCSGLLLGHEVGYWASSKLGPGAAVGASVSILHLYDITTIVLVLLGAVMINCDTILTGLTCLLGVVGVNLCCLMISSELLGKQFTGKDLFALVILCGRTVYLSPMLSAAALKLMKEKDEQEPKPVMLSGNYLHTQEFIV